MDEKKNNLVQQEKRTLFSPFKRFLAEGIGHNRSISRLKQLWLKFNMLENINLSLPGTKIRQ